MLTNDNSIACGCIIAKIISQALDIECDDITLNKLTSGTRVRTSPPEEKISVYAQGTWSKDETKVGKAMTNLVQLLRNEKWNMKEEINKVNTKIRYDSTRNVVILGNTGCGKSTTGNMLLAALNEDTEGAWFAVSDNQLCTRPSRATHFRKAQQVRKMFL